MRAILFFRASLFLVAFFWLPPAFAQTTATILGTVNDSSGAVIPNAKVTVTNLGTDLARSTTTDATGNYTMPLLPVGQYRVRIESPSFQTFEQGGIELLVNQNARVDASLSPGQVTQTVEVEANARQAETVVATLGKVVEQRNIVDLPLNGRNFTQLGVLQPGVNPITPNLSKSGSAAAADQAYNVNGLRTQANVFLIDGALDTDLFFTSSVLRPPPDALQEFKILTNSYQAEFWAGGSVVNVVTRSGTNSLRGTLWEFVRNDNFDARNFFSAKVPPLKQNQFGASGGGPVIFPGLYNGKDKTYFFGYFEGFRNRQGITSNTGVPSMLERQGDFSQSPTKPVNPATKQPFPSNVAPINPISAKLLALYPPPNSGVRTFSASPAQAVDRNAFGVRIDHQLTGRDSLFGHYLYSREEQQLPFAPFSAVVPGFPGSALVTPQTLAFGETHTFSPHVLNDLRLSFVRINFANPLFTRRDKLSDFGFQYATTAPDFETIPFVSISGISGLGNPQGPGIRITNTFEARESVAYATGRHNTKFGFDFRNTRYNIIFGSSENGQFAFTGTFTSNALADFYLGLPATFTQSTIGGGNLRGNTYEVYAQDNFRLRPRLTLDLGLRYTAQTAFPEMVGKFAAFRPGQKSTVRPDAPVGLVYQGDPGIPPGTYNIDDNNFAPRVGFAWDPTGQSLWSVRAGYGVFFEYIPGIAIFNASFSAPPGVPSANVNAPSNYANPLVGIANPFLGKITTPVSFTALAPDLKLPYDQQWNFSIQRQLPGDILIEANYVGTKGTKLIRTRPINPAIFGPGATLANTNARRPFAPNFAGVNQIENSANSHFHGFELSANKRFSHSLSFLASYTFSKAIDDGSFYNISANTNAGNVNAPETPFSLNLERGLSLYDVRNRFVFSGLYDLPFFRGWRGTRGALVGGWQAGLIFAAQSGTPFTVFEPVDVSFTGVGADRPNLLSDPNNGPKTVQQYFNKAAFQRLTQALNAGQLGNEGRDVLIGPCLVSVDFSLMKNLHFTESRYLQFRSEFFNIINRANFNIPDGNIGSATFGQILDARDPRILQFALKLYF